jgi:hypothetical protein
MSLGFLVSAAADDVSANNDSASAIANSHNRGARTGVRLQLAAVPLIAAVLSRSCQGRIDPQSHLILPYLTLKGDFAFQPSLVSGTEGTRRLGRAPKPGRFSAGSSESSPASGVGSSGGTVTSSGSSGQAPGDANSQQSASAERARQRSFRRGWSSRPTRSVRNDRRIG